jgi:pimeloyl-ACP methyl ester carboxylesterase
MSAAHVVNLAEVMSLHPRRVVDRHPKPDATLLDESAGFLGLGRSLTFPWPQWRANDEHRTVYYDEGRGRTLVFIHGLGANGTHWERIATSLVDRYRVVAPDLVGCGWSRKPHVTYSVDLLRDHLIAFLESRGIRHAVLAGHSMGGAVCLAAALKRPDLVEALVLVSAAGVGPLPRWMRAVGPSALRRSVLLPFFVLGASFILDNVFVARPEENEHVRWFRESAMRDDKGMPNLLDFARVCETLCADLLHRDYSPQFHRIHVPVLALWGDADRLTYVPSVLRSLDGFPRLRTVVLRRCGHMPMVERPDETLFHLERFLSSPP